MSESSFSDVCQNIARFGDSRYSNHRKGGWLDPDVGVDVHGWIATAWAKHAGKSNRLYVDEYVKIHDGKLHMVNEINESPYEAIGRCEDTIFSGSEEDCRELMESQHLTEHAWAGSVAELPSLDGLSIATGRESVELFLKDFKLKKEIIEEDSVNQTL